MMGLVSMYGKHGQNIREYEFHFRIENEYNIALFLGRLQIL